MLDRRKKINKTKILIVDDDPSLVQMLRGRLDMNNNDVITAGNGKEGLQMALEEKPDIILLDIKMPVMSGHEMLEALRKDADGWYSSVIMLTGEDHVEDVERARASGVDDYIVKPFDMSKLFEKIHLVIKNRKSAIQ